MSNKIILIIGNGPSTKQIADFGFHKLPDHISTFGMVLAYRYFQKINWWPTYYGVADSKSAFHHRADYYKILHDPSIPTKKFFLSYADFDHPKLEKIEHHSTGSFCFNKALELGYKKIYLIGMEGSYVEEISESREITEEEFMTLGFNRLALTKSLQKLRVITKTPEHNPNYFFDDYQQAGDIYSLPQAHKHRKNWIVSAYEALPKDVEVLNLSQNSKISVFKKIPFKEFIENELHFNPVSIADNDHQASVHNTPKCSIQMESAFYYRYQGDTIPELTQFTLQPLSDNHFLMLISPVYVKKNDGIAFELSFECKKSQKIIVILCRDGQTGFEGNSREIQTIPGLNHIVIKYRFHMEHNGFRMQIGALEEPCELLNISGKKLAHLHNVSKDFNDPSISQFLIAKTLIKQLYFKIRNKTISLLLPESSKRREWAKRIKHKYMNNTIT
jgi:hypothetical protein